MHQLTLFAPTEPAKVLKFPTPAAAPKPQETGLEAIYPQPSYGTCLKCESVILRPGLDACKCSGCGYVATKFVVFSAEYPKVKPIEVVSVEPAPARAFNSAKEPDLVTAKIAANTGALATCEPLAQPSVESLALSIWQPEPAGGKPVAQSNPDIYVNPAILAENSPHSSANYGNSNNSDIASSSGFGIKSRKTDNLATATVSAKGKVLSMFTTRTRAEKMGKPDPFLAGIKTCTRRLMAPSTADYYQRAFISGQTIQIYSSGQYAGGVKWADVRLIKAPYEEALKDMPIEDLVAEGDLWESKDEFIADLCLGRPDPEARPWVLWFEVVKMYV